MKYYRIFHILWLRLRPLSHYTNLNKKCAEIYVLILLGDFYNQFLTLLDTSWRFLNGRKDQELLKIRGTCSKKCVTLWPVLPVLEHFLVLLDNVSAASWWFLNYSWLDLAVLGDSEKIGVNEKELVKNSQEESRSCQDALKMLTRTCNEIL